MQGSGYSRKAGIRLGNHREWRQVTLLPGWTWRIH